MTDTVKKLKRLMRQVRTVIDPTVPVQLVDTLLTVADKEGQTLTEIAQDLGANVSTASRHLLDLGERNRKMEPGYQLVEARSDPMNLRQKHYSLTPKGHLIVKSLEKTLED